MSEWTEQNEHDSKIYSEGYNDGYDDAMCEIVHCKDCIHWKPAEPYEKAHYCEWAGWLVGENGFCVYGERKDDDS